MGDVKGDSQVANEAKVRVFGSDAMLRYGVIEEGYLLHAKFDFAGFDLYSRLSKSASYKS